MIARSKYNDITWIEAFKPTEEEMSALVKEFSLHENISRDVPKIIERSQMWSYNDHIHLVLQFPTIASLESRTKKQEIDFVIGKNFILTAHYETIESLEKLFDSFRDCADTAGICLFATSYDIAYEVILSAYGSIDKALHTIEREIHDIEEHIFNGHQKKAVEHISTVSHKLLSFKKSIRFHKETFSHIEKAGTKKMPQLLILVQQLQEEYAKIWGVILHDEEVLAELQKTNDSLLNYRTNEIMKKLTLLNFLILPIMFVPQALAVISDTGDQIITIVLSVAFSIVAYIYFRRKHWF